VGDKNPYGFVQFSLDEIAAYLRRIECCAIDVPSAEALEQLHFQHIQSIPFENLDIHLGRPIELDVSQIFEKIIRQGRGGFCYELNSLFASLLYSLGFEVTAHAARVVTEGARWIAFGHICLSVKCETDWLVDVGFGNSFQRPLEITKGETQNDEGGEHLLERVEEGWLLSSRIDTDNLDPEYRFDLQPRHLDEFKERCHWTQTSTDSGFTHRTFVTRPIEGGRLTVLGLELRTYQNGAFTERTITPEERANIFVNQFGLPENIVRRLPEGKRAPWFKIEKADERD
jgi:N-hydroxyarylamine O-acetyltransferase